MRAGLGSIKVFVVVASVRSFTQAAQLLHVTQGAVSQQIAKLEHLLGVRLFDREAKRLTLTQQGQRLYLGVGQSLERIEAELDALVCHDQDEVLAMTTFGSFAAQWLVPRLPDFESRHPNILLHVDTSTRLVNFDDEAVEIGIRFGHGQWPGLRAEFLFSHRIYPVATKTYVEKSKLGTRIEEMLDHPLYYDLESPTEWLRWFAKAGLPENEIRLGRGFTDTLVMLSALKSGIEGIALIGDHLTQQDVQNGQLVRLFDTYIEADGAYYLVYPQHSQLTPKATAFREWLLQAIQ